MTIMETTPKQLRVSVEISLRYHNRRRAFFEFLHKLVSAVGVIGGSAAFVALVSNLSQTWTYSTDIATWGAFAVAVLSILDLVIGFGPMARLHHSLFQRFVMLAADMDKTRKPTDDQFDEWKSQKLMIDHDEPPPFHALYVLCKNDVMAAMNTEEAQSYMVPVPYWRRCLAQFLKQPSYIGTN